MTKTRFIKSPNGYNLAYTYTQGDVAKSSVVFLGGFCSDMQGTKAIFLEKLAKEENFSYLRLDYGGHGESGGVFKDCSIQSWFEDALHIIEQITDGDLNVIGSSMGGWISYLIAEAISDRVKALISIAPAPDFTDEFLDDMNTEQKTMYDEKGYFTAPNEYSDEPYIFSKKLIEESRQCFLLEKGIAYNGPVHILHGTDDHIVPIDKPERIKKALSSQNVEIHYIEGGDHSLSQPENLELLKNTLFSLQSRIKQG